MRIIQNIETLQTSVIPSLSFKNSKLTKGDFAVAPSNNKEGFLLYVMSMCVNVCTGRFPVIRHEHGC